MKKLFILLAAMLTFTSTAFAQIGSLASDLVFTPVTPCRIFDTRPSEGGTGALTAGSTRTFYVRSASTFAGQGGTATDCGMIAGTNVAAIAINVVVIAPTTPGFITAYPSDASRPLAATVNFVAGDVLGNASVVKVSQGFTAAHLSIYTSSNVNVVGDVVGYYSRPVATALECVTTSPIFNSINAGPLNGLYYAGAIPSACPSGYTQTSLQCSVDNATASASVLSSANCAGNSPVNTHTLSASRTCCRIPGR